jgi:hypothetical protein
MVVQVADGLQGALYERPIGGVHIPRGDGHGGWVESRGEEGVAGTTIDGQHQVSIEARHDERHGVVVEQLVEHAFVGANGLVWL